MCAGWRRGSALDTDDVTVIERDLMALFPQKEWGDLTDVLIAHGRACCTAKKPQCPVLRDKKVVPVSPEHPWKIKKK